MRLLSAVLQSATECIEVEICLIDLAVFPYAALFVVLCDFADRWPPLNSGKAVRPLQVNALYRGPGLHDSDVFALAFSPSLDPHMVS